MKYGGTTSEVLDEIDYNRKKLLEKQKADDVRAYEGMKDKVIVMDMFKKV